MSFKFGGVDKYTVFLFVYLLVLFVFVYIYIYKKKKLLCCLLGMIYIIIVEYISLVHLTCLNTAYH